MSRRPAWNGTVPGLVFATLTLLGCGSASIGSASDGGVVDDGSLPTDDARPGTADSRPRADARPGSPDAPLGSAGSLRFAIVGDTRPANEDDTTNYPTAVITKIYEDLEGASPRPDFAVSTGDYMFAN